MPSVDFFVTLIRYLGPAEPGLCTGRIGGEADEDVLPFMAWSSRFTALQGLCQMFSAGSIPRRRTGHPDTSVFVPHEPALYEKVCATRNLHQCVTGGGVGHVNLAQRRRLHRLRTIDQLERRWQSNPETRGNLQVSVLGSAERGGQ